MDSLRQDLRSSLRHFRRHRGFVAAAVLVLALGIGATTAVFSVSETLLLRPLPHPDGDRLVALRSVRRAGDFPSTRAAPGTLADWQRQATSFDAVAGYRWISVDLIDGARSHRLSGLLATPELFEVLGVPVTGRAFVAGDRGAGTVVLGRDAWRRLFDADESLIGGTIDLNAVFAREVADAVRTLPSVTEAAVVQGVPMGAGGFFGSGVIEGYVPPAGAEEPIYRLRVVSPATSPPCGFPSSRAGSSRRATRWASGGTTAPCSSASRSRGATGPGRIRSAGASARSSAMRNGG